VTAQSPGCGSTSDARKRMGSTVETEAAEQHELERLRAWKQEALPVISGLQELGRALGLPLGVQITGPVGVTAARSLRMQYDASQEALSGLLTEHRILVEAAKALLGRFTHSEECSAHPPDDRVADEDCDCWRSGLRAVLEGGADRG
jgi:hypothetical protein